MATAVIMPRQGQSVESCIITKWHKKKGDPVKIGDILFTYETDKATFEEEAKVEGILLEMFFEEGDDVPVLMNVCAIGDEGEDVSHLNPQKQHEEEGDKSPAAGQIHLELQEKKHEEQKAGTGLRAADTDNGGKEGQKISPRARNLAGRTGIDFRSINGTGPYGRVIERDINEAIEKGHAFTLSAKDGMNGSCAAGMFTGTGLGGRITTDDLREPVKEMKEPAKPFAPDYTEVKLTNIRKIIGKTMHQSLSTTAQLTLNTSFDASDILSYRRKIKEYGEELGLPNITLNDIILFAVSRTILNHKELNAHFAGGSMLLFNRVNLGVAVDTKRGLMVPTIFNADLKSLSEISHEARTLAKSCQEGTINPDLLKGGSFTVTNLGALGIESFTPVINPPQTGILGVNTVEQRVKKIDEDYVYYPAMSLSLTFDHRAIDGVPAARFLKDLSTSLENFSALLAK